MSKKILAIFIITLLSSTSRADIEIVTTIKPLALIAGAVLGDRGSATSILDPNQSPHHFSLSPSDRMALARADMTLWIGPQFETFLGDFFSQREIASKSISAIGIPNLTLHNVGDDQIDAHLWLDSANAEIIAATIMQRLVTLDPDNAASYRRNLQDFTSELSSRNEQIAQRFRSQPSQSYGVYHNAYQYFERQFGLQHELVLLEDPETQPSIRQIVQLRAQVEQLRPSCLLIEIESSQDLIDTVLSGHQLKRITVDLLGAKIDSTRYGYAEFLSNVADDFYRCLYE